MKKVVFVSNCLLNQNIRARGVKNTYKENGKELNIIKPLVKLLAKYDVAIEQLPCVEIYYEGLYRKACGQDKYLNNKFLKICRRHVNETVFLIKEMKKNNFDIKAIIGVDGSPTCGVDRTSLGRGIFDKDKGIFMKLLYKELKKNKINIPFIGARLKNRKEFEEFLKKVEKRIK